MELELFSADGPLHLEIRTPGGAHSYCLAEGGPAPRWGDAAAFDPAALLRGCGDGDGEPGPELWGDA